MKKAIKICFGDKVEFWVESAEQGDYYILQENEMPNATGLEILAQNRYLLDLIARTSEKLHAVSKASIDIFFHAANHNMPYTGPNYEKELQELDKVAKTFIVPENIEEK